jgi:hypothetical protein
MKKITAHISGLAYADFQQCKGESDSDKLRWLVWYWGEVLEAARKRKAEAKKPAVLAALAAVGADVASEPGPVEAANAVRDGAA